MKEEYQKHLLFNYKYRGFALPTFMHLCYNNIHEPLPDIYRRFINSNIKIFKPYYKRFKKLRSRNYFIFSIDIGSLNFIIHSIETANYKHKLYKNTRKEYYSKRPMLLKSLLKKQNQCQHCRSFDKLSIDHKKPIYLGGTNNLSNLQILCRSCNSKKGIKIQI